MLDIEKELKALGRYKQQPGEALRESTRLLVQDELKRARAGVHRFSAKHRRRSIRRAAVSAVAAVLILAALLIFSPLHTVQAAAYYTVDINPSVSLSVDSHDKVLSAYAANSDAEALLDGLELSGLPFADALDIIVRTAADGGWLKDNGHVLVAHFGGSPGMSEHQAAGIVSEAAGHTVSVLVLQSTREDYEAANRQHKSAGLELLRKSAESLGIDGKLTAEEMISAFEERLGGNQNNQETENVSPVEKPSSTRKPSSPGENSGGGNKQDNEKGNGNKPEKPIQSGKPDQKENSSPPGNGQVSGDETGKGNSGQGSSNGKNDMQ